MMRASISRGLRELLLSSARLLQGDWLTFCHDPQRLAWAMEESQLTFANGNKLQLKWSAPLDNLTLAFNSLSAAGRDIDVILVTELTR